MSVLSIITSRRRGNSPLYIDQSRSELNTAISCTSFSKNYNSNWGGSAFVGTQNGNFTGTKICGTYSLCKGQGVFINLNQDNPNTVQFNLTTAFGCQALSSQADSTISLTRGKITFSYYNSTHNTAIYSTGFRVQLTGPNSTFKFMHVVNTTQFSRYGMFTSERGQHTYLRFYFTNAVDNSFMDSKTGAILSAYGGYSDVNFELMQCNFYNNKNLTYFAHFASESNRVYLSNCYTDVTAHNMPPNRFITDHLLEAPIDIHSSLHWTENCLYIAPTPHHTPEITPKTTPQLTLNQSPEQTPFSTTVTTPFSTPIQTPEQTPEQTPFSTPATTPFSTPIQTPEQTPFATPENTPFSTPEFTPDSTPENTPNQSPELTPFATPENTPTFTPETTPNQSPDLTPHNTPELTPKESPLSVIPTEDIDLEIDETTTETNDTDPLLFPNSENNDELARGLNDKDFRVIIENKWIIIVIIAAIIIFMLILLLAFLIYLSIKNPENASSELTVSDCSQEILSIDNSGETIEVSQCDVDAPADLPDLEDSGETVDVSDADVLNQEE